MSRVISRLKRLKKLFLSFNELPAAEKRAQTGAQGVASGRHRHEREAGEATDHLQPDQEAALLHLEALEEQRAPWAAGGVPRRLSEPKTITSPRLLVDRNPLAMPSITAFEMESVRPPTGVVTPQTLSRIPCQTASKTAPVHRKQFCRGHCGHEPCL